MVLIIWGGTSIDIVAEVVGQLRAHHLLQLLEVFHGVLALPERRFPLLFGDVLPAGKAPPVGLGELAPDGILEGLRAGADVARGRPHGPRSRGAHGGRFYIAFEGLPP
jgi:hypothetical protein